MVEEAERTFARRVALLEPSTVCKAAVRHQCLALFRQPDGVLVALLFERGLNLQFSEFQIYSSIKSSNIGNATP